MRIATAEPVTYQGEALLLYCLAPDQTRQDAIRSQFYITLLAAIECLPVMSLTLRESKEALVALALETSAGDTADRFAMRVVEKSRQKFIAYFDSRTPAELLHVEPLLYRLVPREAAFRDVWRRLYERWGIHACWFLHINPETTPGPVIEFYTDDLFRHFGAEGIRTILHTHGITQVWEISAWNSENNAVRDLAQVEFFHGYEHFWTAEPIDWLIYISHEDTMTFAGDWLVAAIFAAWPGWSECWHVRVNK